MEKYSGYNIAVILFAAFGSWLTGYGLGIIITTLGQPTFYVSLGITADTTSPDYTHTTDFISTIQGIFFAAGFFGCLFAGFVGSRFGRLRGFQVCALVCVIGGAIQTGSVNQGMYIASRLIQGFGTGHALAALPVYFAEVSPPHSRGLMSGAHGCGINLGYASANWIGFGCFHSSTSFAWRFPNAFFIILALCFGAGTAWIPESPRWLVINGREQEALAILCRLHHDSKDPNDSFAHNELRIIHSQIIEDNRALKEWGKWQVFTQKTYRRRLILSAMVVMGAMNTGILAISNYTALLYQSLGLSNSEALILAAGYNTFGLVANLGGTFASDRVGRRRLFITGFITTLIALVITTALIAKYNENPTKGYAAGAVTMLFIYGATYGSMIDVNAWTIATETFPSHLRAQGSSYGISTLMLVSVLWVQLAPTAMATIGWKYYIVFIVLTLCHVIYFWFQLPETSGLALEEIDMLFGKEPAAHLDSGNDIEENGGSKTEQDDRVENVVGGEGQKTN